MVLACPRCQTPMVPLRVSVDGSAVVVDVCTHACGGVWLDDTDQRSGLDPSDDLPGLLPDPPAAAVDCSGPVLCPVCAGPTERFRWNATSPIFLDACAAGHGTWFDGGELTEMEAWETQQLL